MYYIESVRHQIRKHLVTDRTVFYFKRHKTDLTFQQKYRVPCIYQTIKGITNPYICIFLIFFIQLKIVIYILVYVLFP